MKTLLMRAGWILLLLGMDGLTAPVLAEEDDDDDRSPKAVAKALPSKSAAQKPLPVPPLAGQPATPQAPQQLPPVAPQAAQQPLPQAPLTVAQAPPLPTVPETVVPGEPSTGDEAGPRGPPSDQQPSAMGPFGPGGVFSSQVPGPFLPDVEGTRIMAGKKTFDIDLQERPELPDNNFRQILIKTPGLLVSEESFPLTAIGYRGLDPDRNQFMQMMEDGFYLGANIMGFNESYYIPPYQVVDRIEFIHGGSALMYGPQPGGALNFVTRMPLTDTSFSMTSENTFGSHNMFTTYDNISGTTGPFGYYAYGVHRQSNGFRDFNSQYNINYGGLKMVYQIDDHSRIIANFNSYYNNFGEPGRLTRENFYLFPHQSTRRNDYFQITRNFAGLTYQNAIDDGCLLETRIWGNDFDRFSRRQRDGGFGQVPTGTLSDFRQEIFNVFGIEPRYRMDYALFTDEAVHTLSGGMLYYYNHGVRRDSRGPVLGSGEVGPIPRIYTQRDTDYASFFAENRFKFGKLSIVPGIRLECINQNLEETTNVEKTAAGLPLGAKRDWDYVPLGGIGLTYEFAPKVELYSNASQAYRPKLFQETISPATDEIVAGDVAASNSYQVDLGFRASPTNYWWLDTSLFYLELNNQVGLIGNIVTNTGAFRNTGWEFASQVDLIGLSDEFFDSGNVERFGSLDVFYNNMILDAHFFKGPLVGNVPQYAPHYIMKGGFAYHYRESGDAAAAGRSYYGSPDLFKLWFTGTFVGRHFGDDGNTPDFFIPSYKVWDLTGEVRVYKDVVTFFGGIYNVFNEQYFARVRGDGIDPQDGRNYYAGFRIFW